MTARMAVIVAGMGMVIQIGMPVLAYDNCPYGYYENVDGQCIHKPVYGPSHRPGETAVCCDGSRSFSTHHSGTCSHHGGVCEWERTQ